MGQHWERGCAHLLAPCWSWRRAYAELRWIERRVRHHDAHHEVANRLLTGTHDEVAHAGAGHPGEAGAHPVAAKSRHSCIAKHVDEQAQPPNMAREAASC